MGYSQLIGKFELNLTECKIWDRERKIDRKRGKTQTHGQKDRLIKREREKKRQSQMIGKFELRAKGKDRERERDRQKEREKD